MVDLSCRSGRGRRSPDPPCWSTGPGILGARDETTGTPGRSIAAEDGLIWKVWTEDPTASVAGGAYLFADEESASRCIDKHTRRLGSFGITDARISSLGVNEQLSRTTFAALERD